MLKLSRAGAVFLTVAGMGPATLARAQPSAFVGPDYIGTFEAVVDGKRVDLERRPVQTKGKAKMLGFGGASAYMQVDGDRSPVRFKASSDIQFVVRVADQSRDPQTQVIFSKAEIKNSRRRAKTDTMGFMALSTRSTEQLGFKAIKVGTQFFRIAPTTKLASGEYMLSLRPVSIEDYARNSQAAYLFAVDD